MMNRIDAYNAYNVNRDFRYIANALGFHGFAYDDDDDEDADFRTKLEQDEELSDLLYQFEDIESSQFLIYTQNTTDFYQKHEHDIISYLKIYGYDDDDYYVRPIEDIICSRVVAYVTGVLSEYDY